MSYKKAPTKIDLQTINNDFFFTVNVVLFSIQCEYIHETAGYMFNCSIREHISLLLACPHDGMQVRL